ncbi:MAG: hypothetical protein CSYNP_04527 [Syntrophus sp. SKADARSKE-3]|nr:hypothetical protein [Syntrophus sp. SKADARSKE-3]
MHPPLIEQNDPIAVQGSQIYVMGDGDDGHARLPVKSSHEIKKCDLMVEIEKSRGFVQKKNLRFLCQSAGDHYPLSLTPAQSGHGPVRKGQDIRLGHSPSCDVQIILRFEPEQADMGRPSH